MQINEKLRKEIPARYRCGDAKKKKKRDRKQNIRFICVVDVWLSLLVFFFCAFSDGFVMKIYEMLRVVNVDCVHVRSFQPTTKNGIKVCSGKR